MDPKKNESLESERGMINEDPDDLPEYQRIYSNDDGHIVSDQWDDNDLGDIPWDW